MTSRRVDRAILLNLYWTQHLSLGKIGIRYGVCRERVRQWMERENIIRRPVGPKFASSSEYFNHVQSGGKESVRQIRRFILNKESRCSKCGRKRKLHIHHIKYPGLSRDDFDILCLPCHFLEHMKNRPNGGRYRNPPGYVMVSISLLSKKTKKLLKPMFSKEYKIYEHRLIMARKLGRPLKRSERVRHLNGIRDDNRPENLFIGMAKA